MTEEEKKAITPEQHPGRAAQGHKLAALMKKRKEEILRDKEQSTVQPTVQSTVQSTEQPSVQASVQATVQPSVQSNDTHIYGVGIVAVLAIGACVFFAYNKKSSQLQTKNKPTKNNLLNHQNEVICFKYDGENTPYINE